MKVVIANTAGNINFVGNGITANAVGANITVTVPGFYDFVGNGQSLSPYRIVYTSAPSGNLVVSNILQVNYELPYAGPIGLYDRPSGVRIVADTTFVVPTASKQYVSWISNSGGSLFGFGVYDTGANVSGNANATISSGVFEIYADTTSPMIISSNGNISITGTSGNLDYSPEHGLDVKTDSAAEYFVIHPSAANLEAGSHGVYFADNTYQWTAAFNSPLTVQDEGSNLTTNANTINFIGNGISANASGSTVNVTVNSTIYTLSTADGSTNYTANIVLTGAANSNAVIGVANVAGLPGLTIDGSGAQITLAHADTSTVANISNVQYYFVNNVRFDTYGHVTSIGTGRQTTYTLSSDTKSGGANIVLNGTDGIFANVGIVGSGYTTVTQTGNVITVSSTGGGGGGDTVANIGNISGTTTLDRTTASIQRANVTANLYLATPSNMVTGDSLTLILTHTAANIALTTDASFKFASNYRTLSTTINSIDMLNMFYDGVYYYVTLTTGYA